MSYPPSLQFDYQPWAQSPAVTAGVQSLSWPTIAMFMYSITEASTDDLKVDRKAFKYPWFLRRRSICTAV